MDETTREKIRDANVRLFELRQAGRPESELRHITEVIAVPEATSVISASAEFQDAVRRASTKQEYYEAVNTYRARLSNALTSVDGVWTGWWYENRDMGQVARDERDRLKQTISTLTNDTQEPTDG